MKFCKKLHRGPSLNWNNHIFCSKILIWKRPNVWHEPVSCEQNHSSWWSCLFSIQSLFWLVHNKPNEKWPNDVCSFCNYSFYFNHQLECFIFYYCHDYFDNYFICLLWLYTQILPFAPKSFGPGYDTDLSHWSSTKFFPCHLSCLQSVKNEDHWWKFGVVVGQSIQVWVSLGQKIVWRRVATVRGIMFSLSCQCLPWTSFWSNFLNRSNFFANVVLHVKFQSWFQTTTCSTRKSIIFENFETSKKWFGLARMIP